MYVVLTFILYIALFLEKIYTAGKNFTLPPAVTALTNLTVGSDHDDNDVGKEVPLLLFPKVLVKQLRAAPFM